MIGKIYAKYFIWYYNLSFLRNDRGAIEYYCKSKLSKKLWNDKFKAMTIYNYILWDSISSSNNDKILKHELEHVKQYLKYGTIRFKILYALESLIKGYDKNKFEEEANKKET